MDAVRIAIAFRRDRTGKGGLRERLTDGASPVSVAELYGELGPAPNGARLSPPSRGLRYVLPQQTQRGRAG